MSNSIASLPRPLLLAGVATLAMAVFSLVMAVLSLSTQHGIFSGGVALALALWALIVGGIGYALLRRSFWARGPVVAAGLLHLFAYGEFARTAPLAIIGALAGLIAVVGAVMPSTRAALSRD